MPSIRHEVTRSALIIPEERPSLREWWHNTLRSQGCYPCYAIFLTLPSDTEAFLYLTVYGSELNVISGKNCLVIALSETDYQLHDFDQGIWRKAVEEHTNEGHSVTVAKLFGIEFTEFPCLLVFQDIRSPEYVIIKLTGMTAAEIAVRMRLIFAVVQIAVEDGKRPLEELEKQQNIEFLRKTGESIASKAGKLAEKTFEKAMEAWIKATIKY